MTISNWPSQPSCASAETMPESLQFLEAIRNVDWASTPIGPMDGWPARLQQTFNQVLADSRPIALYWGPSYTTIYNEAFSKLCGCKHPHLLGQPVDEAWPDVCERLKETMCSCASARRPSREQEWRFFVEKESDDTQGAPTWLEETYLKWSITPITEDDECLGFLHPVLETTSTRLWERRTKMLIELGNVLITARDTKSYWAKTIEELEAVQPEHDIPLVILYSVSNDPDALTHGSRKYESSKVCSLEGSLGVPAGHPIIPEKLALRTSDGGLSLMFREALRVQQPLLVQTKDGSLPRELLEGLEWRGFGDACRAAVICPLRPTKEENVMGLLLLGLNPRRPYDNNYQQYVALLNQKLTTSLASTVLLEEEARRGRNMAEQAAYEQAMLKQKLDAQTKEATESVQKFEVVAEFIPVGMCFGDIQGNIGYANAAWYRITGRPAGTDRLLSCVVEEDKPIVVRAYEELQRTRNVNFEFRVKRHGNGSSQCSPRTQTSPSFERNNLDLPALDDQAERYVLASAEAERAADGSVVRVLTCLTDVTMHKKTAEEAIRRAQQAENFRRMAEFATVGMYDMDLEGRLLGANNVFLEMCGLEKVDLDDVVVKPWETCVYEEDYPLLQEKLEAMVAEGKVQNVEVRFKMPWAAEDKAGHRVVAPRWVQVTLLPVRNPEGVIGSFTGCLDDVSLQKWQLEREKQRKEDALESKRQQENFIDMTSHEMRNPLSAIVHCADAITGTLSKVQELVRMQPLASDSIISKKMMDLATSDIATEHREAKDALAEAEQLIDNCIDNAETIAACAQHQRRIVDDILTMSKLGYKLVAPTPTTVNTIEVVQDALKMFEIEARRVDINLSMEVDRSYHDMNLKYLDFDPSRLKQVLINLLTNALKFTTKSGPTRNVSVKMRASRTRPTEASSSVQFIPRSEDPEDSCEGELNDQPAPRERGDPIFLMFEVKDTGQGLTEEEKKLLFQRFVQASSRTHVKYGGSGLGLFISRRLTELQNGAIGVASVPGVGSTFAFYIESYVPTSASIEEAEASAAAAEEQAAATTPFRGRRDGKDKEGVTTAVTTIPPPSRRGTARPGEAPCPEIEGVLIVEDNLINQQITRRGLLERKFIVDVANHGVEALDKLRLTDRFAGPPEADDEAGRGATPANDEAAADGGTGKKFPLSLILMDIEMPIQDGLTCTRRIRELEGQGRIRGGRIPIIAVSANARMEQILEAKAAGCDDVLVKPYRMPELIEKMNDVVARVAVPAADRHHRAGIDGVDDM